MKYATKYMVVPFSQTGAGPIQDPEEYLIEKLDKDMSTILAQKLNIDAKLKLYSQSLARFTTIYKPSFSLPSVLAEMASKASVNEKKLSDKLDDINIKLENNDFQEEIPPKIKRRKIKISNTEEPLISTTDLVKKKIPKKKKILPEEVENVLITKRKTTKPDFYQAESITTRKKKVTGTLTTRKKKRVEDNIVEKESIFTAKPNNPIEFFDANSEIPVNEDSEIKFATPPATFKNLFYKYTSPSTYLNN